MLKKFALRNYKNFRDEIELDLGNVAGYQFSNDCISNGTITKMLIYGRNATGKSNLARAIMDIYHTMFSEWRMEENAIFLNADSTEDSAEFSYTFDFDGTELVYKYKRFSYQELKDEELVIDGVSIYSCDFANRKYCFDNLKYVDAETANVNGYIQSMEGDEASEDTAEPRLPFLRWLISNMALKYDSVLIRLSNYVNRMVVIASGNGRPFRAQMMNKVFYDLLEKTDGLKDLEDFFNAMGIECRLVLKQLPDDRKELYFAHEKLVPFISNASSGTLALLELYRRFVCRVREASLVYFDEFDAFYHYEMAENVIKFLKKKYPRCQVIMTTHNTNLMTNRLMRPDCMFILSRRGTLTALCNATSRELREGHNLEKMYISGEFEMYE